MLGGVKAMDSKSGNNPPQALAGLRLLEVAGPYCGKLLASLGAEVIKIENAARLDITRRPHAMYGKPPSSFEQMNANKRSVTLNLKEPRAVELALALVSISDLVLENFRPGVMDRLGLGYPRLRQVPPRGNGIGGTSRGPARGCVGAGHRHRLPGSGPAGLCDESPGELPPGQPGRGHGAPGRLPLPR
jgi:hypothetical protein